jgi:hypothetical protein
LVMMLRLRLPRLRLLRLRQRLHSNAFSHIRVHFKMATLYRRVFGHGGDVFIYQGAS